MENPQEIVRSWTSQTGWQSGPVVVNKLLPDLFGRITVPFVQSWRTQNLPTLDWGAKDFSIIMPEGVRCISAAYLEIDIPSSQLKAYPGLYCIDTFRMRSAGQIVYECNYADFIADHCETLRQQKLDNFARIYLGGKAAVNPAAPCAVKLPLLLPNSTYMRRSDQSTAGHGVFSSYTGNSRIELEITLNSNLFPGRVAGSDDPPSIAGHCRIVYHTVTVPDNQKKF